MRIRNLWIVDKDSGRFVRVRVNTQVFDDKIKRILYRKKFLYHKISLISFWASLIFYLFLYKFLLLVKDIYTLFFSISCFDNWNERTASPLFAYWVEIYISVGWRMLSRIHCEKNYIPFTTLPTVDKNLRTFITELSPKDIIGFQFSVIINFSVFLFVWRISQCLSRRSYMKAHIYYSLGFSLTFCLAESFPLHHFVGPCSSSFNLESKLNFARL